MKRLIFKLKVTELKDSEPHHYQYSYTVEQRKWFVYVYIGICSPILIPMYLIKLLYDLYWKQFEVNQSEVKSMTLHNKKSRRRIFKELLKTD